MIGVLRHQEVISIIMTLKRGRGEEREGERESERKKKKRKTL